MAVRPRLASTCLDLPRGPHEGSPRCPCRLGLVRGRPCHPEISMLALSPRLNSQPGINALRPGPLQAQHGEGHGRAVGPRPPSRVRRWRRVGMADRQPLVEEGHDHLLRLGSELLEKRRRVRVGRLEQDLGRGAHTVRGLRRQGLRLEALRDVEEDLVGLLADGRVLPGELVLVSLSNIGKHALNWGFWAELD